MMLNPVIRYRDGGWTPTLSGPPLIARSAASSGGLRPSLARGLGVLTRPRGEPTVAVLIASVCSCRLLTYPDVEACRNSFGLMPVAFVTARVKWAASVKPQAKPMAESEALPSISMWLALRIWAARRMIWIDRPSSDRRRCKVRADNPNLTARPATVGTVNKSSSMITMTWRDRRPRGWPRFPIQSPNPGRERQSLRLGHDLAIGDGRDLFLTHSQGDRRTTDSGQQYGKNAGQYEIDRRARRIGRVAKMGGQAGGAPVVNSLRLWTGAGVLR